MIGLTVRKVSMTEMQKGIFLDCQIGNPDAYHIAATIRIRNLDEALLEQALTLLIHEQAALRCCVDFVDDPAWPFIGKSRFHWSNMTSLRSKKIEKHGPGTSSSRR